MQPKPTYHWKPVPRRHFDDPYGRTTLVVDAEHTLVCSCGNESTLERLVWYEHPETREVFAFCSCGKANKIDAANQSRIKLAHPATGITLGGRRYFIHPEGLPGDEFDPPESLGEWEHELPSVRTLTCPNGHEVSAESVTDVVGLYHEVTRGRWVYHDHLCCAVWCSECGQWYRLDLPKEWSTRRARLTWGPLNAAEELFSEGSEDLLINKSQYWRQS